MTLTQKESTLLKDLRTQEQLCVDKYTKYSSEACDAQLKNLFSQIRDREQQHIQTLDQIASGTVPQMAQGGSQQQSQMTAGSQQQQPQMQAGSQQQQSQMQAGSQQQPQMQGGSQQQQPQMQAGSQQQQSQMQAGSQQQSQTMQFRPSNGSAQEKQKDAYLCHDALSTEKHVSSTYNTCIFEFRDSAVRNALNHIQKEEQQHGEQLYNYMSANGMYS